MGRRKLRYKDPAASIGEKDNFGMIYDSMCKSKAYKTLSLGAKHFYTLCRVQSQSAQGRACLYKHREEENSIYTERDFVFPAKHLAIYGVDRSNANKYFKQLEAAGFIEVKENNKHRKKVNVYSFSARWKNSS